MSKEHRKVSYYNTLIFTIVAAIISVLLLLGLMFKGGRDYLPFIITLEVGIFSIIAYCIILIIQGERKSNKQKLYALSQLSFNICPDYFVKRTIGDREICSNEYVVKDDKNRRSIIKIFPEDDKLNPIGGLRPLPETHSFNYKGDEAKYDKFYLSEIESEKLLTAASDKCSILYKTPTDPALSYLKGYNLTPWTTMRAKCASAKT